MAAWRQRGARSADRPAPPRARPDRRRPAARRAQFSSLSTGDLINDAVLRLIQADQPRSCRPRPFHRARLADDAPHPGRSCPRQKAAAKRRHVKVELCTNIDGGQRFDLIRLESALIRLGAIDAQLTELVEMRYFGGMTIADVAIVTGLSEPTVKRRWQVARAWLTDALDQSDRR